MTEKKKIGDFGEQAAADHLGEVDIDAINEGIEALSGAGSQLQNLDIKKLNSVIESLGTVTAQLEKTTGTISRIFGK